VQLLQAGFFHSDPHPGNLMRPDDQTGAKLVLIDFGLVAKVEQDDMDAMVSSIVHLANKDYAALVDDFIRLEILPTDCNRGKVIPLMDKALSPYVKGGGAKQYEEELKKMYGMDGSVDGAVGGFQAMTNDMLTVLNDIPFSIPAYFALLARAVVTLEGLALSADPSYGLVIEAYPFVARKLLASDRPELQQALQQVLYSGTSPGGEGMRGVITPTRLAGLLNSAAGIVAKQEGQAFVDLDAVPEDGVSAAEALSYVLSPGAASLRTLLAAEARANHLVNADACNRTPRAVSVDLTPETEAARQVCATIPQFNRQARAHDWALRERALLEMRLETPPKANSYHVDNGSEATQRLSLATLVLEEHTRDAKRRIEQARQTIGRITSADGWTPRPVVRSQSTGRLWLRSDYSEPDHLYHSSSLAKQRRDAANAPRLRRSKSAERQRPRAAGVH